MQPNNLPLILEMIIFFIAPQYAVNSHSQSL